jgi:hypothetical protein
LRRDEQAWLLAPLSHFAIHAWHVPRADALASLRMNPRRFKCDVVLVWSPEHRLRLVQLIQVERRSSSACCSRATPMKNVKMIHKSLHLLKGSRDRELFLGLSDL